MDIAHQRLYNQQLNRHPLAQPAAVVAWLGDALLHEVIDGQTYWFAAGAPPALVEDSAETAYLLPNYDEYIVGYTDRSAVFDAAHTAQLDPRGNIVFSHTIVIGGRVVGTWKRTLKKDAVLIDATLLAPLTETEAHAVTAAADRYGRFLGLPATLRL